MMHFPIFLIAQRASVSFNLVLTDNVINGVRCMSGFRPVSRNSWNRGQETTRDQKQTSKWGKSQEFDRSERRPPRPGGGSGLHNRFPDNQPPFQKDTASQKEDAPQRSWDQDASYTQRRTFQGEKFFEFNRPERGPSENQRPSGGSSMSRNASSDYQPRFERGQKSQKAEPQQRRNSWSKGRDSFTGPELDSRPSKPSVSPCRPKEASTPGGSTSTDLKSESEKKGSGTQRSSSSQERPKKTAWDIVCEIRMKAAEETRSQNSQKKSEENENSSSQEEENSNFRNRRQNVNNRTDLDSKGYKTYSHVVPQWDKMTSDDVIGFLKKCIIYNEYDIVALNKPYGLPVHGGPSVHHSVAKYLPNLASLLDKSGKMETLHMVNRIDKETTGVLLLARTSQTAAKLNDMFVKRIIKKFYWALTKHVPSPLKGIIDIPIGDSRATGTYRRVLRPDRTPSSSLVMTRKTRLQGSRAVTAYTVLGSRDDCALVELSPTTGVKHQVRIHLSHGLNCPVLGDHKYSHFTKLAPQRLPMSILKKLQLRQEKVRTLPMHLHARAIVIPEFAEIGNIRISAELPKYFYQTMSKLKVRENVFD